MLEPYNIETLEKATNLLTGESEEAKSFQQDLDSEAKDFMQNVNSGMSSYKDSLLAADASDSGSNAS